MANGTTPGLLEQFGLSNLSEEELALQRAQGLSAQDSAGSAARTRGQDPASQQAGRIGALIGGGVGRSISGQGLVSDSESARLEAVQAAQKRVEEALQRNPKMAGLQGEAKQNIFQQVLADELGKRGEIELGLQIGADLQQKRRVQKAQDLELEKLGISRDKDEQEIESNRNSLTRDRRGEVTTIYPKGSNDPNTGETAFIQNDGNAVRPDGSTVPLGEFTIVRPVAARGGKPLTANDLGVSDKEQEKLRDQAAAVMGQARGAMQMVDALSEVAQAGKGVNIMDGTGALTSGTDKILNILGGVARQIGATIDVLDAAGNSKGNLSAGAAANKYVNSNFNELDSRMQGLVPANIRNDAGARAKYYSALTRITYAQARAQEPGARQLSDTDFKNAMAVMAGNASDPDAFRQVMIGNMTENVNAFNDRREFIGDEVMNLIIKPAGMQRFEDTMAQFNERFSKDFGSASAPGPGLLPPPTGDAGTTEQVGGATVVFD